MPKIKICPCGARSVPGLIPSVALCQKHYNGLMFGSGDEHKQGVLMLKYSQQGVKLYSENKKRGK